MRGPEAEITILMALFNGARHLRAQLDSFAAQAGVDWALIVSDDGSTDAGPAILDAFAADHPGHAVRRIDGPRRGFAQNFLHLLMAAGPETPMVALSDHDDVWLPEKLARAAAALADQPAGRPALFCARTRIVGPQLEEGRLSPVWRRPFGFANALVQNVAAGNTIVLNRAALDLAQEAIRRAQAAGAADIVAHDWWLYQIVAGAGGRVIRDNRPALLYRQHPTNEMGRNDTARARIARIRKIAGGDFRDWNRRNIAALRAAGDLLTPGARATLDTFATLREAGPMGRLAGLRRAGLYRQTRPAGVMLWISALMGWL